MKGMSLTLVCVYICFSSDPQNDQAKAILKGIPKVGYQNTQIRKTLHHYDVNTLQGSRSVTGTYIVWAQIQADSCC